MKKAMKTKTQRVDKSAKDTNKSITDKDSNLSDSNNLPSNILKSDVLCSLLLRLPVGVYRTTTEGKITYANPAFARILGYESPDELLNRSISDFYLSKSAREAIVNEILSANKEISYEIQLFRFDGRLIWIKDIATSFKSDVDDTYYLEGIIEDITEKKEYQESLIESDKRFRQLFENIQDIYFQLDLFGRIVTASPSSEKLTGYSIPELIGMNIRNLLDGAKYARQFMSGIIKNGRIKSFISPMRRKDGTKLFVETNGHIYLDSSGRSQGIECITRDINSEVRSREYLSVLYNISKAINNTQTFDELFGSIHTSLSSIINTTNFFIALADRERNVITFPYFVDEKNNSVGEIDLFASESLTAKVINNGEPLLLSDEEIDRIVYQSSGFIGPKTKCWLGVPLKTSGKVIGALGLQSYSNPNLFTEDDLIMLEPLSDQIALAIDRKKSALALNFQLEFLQNLMNTIPSPIYHKNVQRVYVGCNKAFENYFGIREAELLGKTVFDIFPDDFAEMADSADIDLLMNPRVQQYETTIRMLDGSIRNVVFYKTCFNDHYGKTAGLVGVMMDITDRIRAEKELKESKEFAELIHRVTPNCIYTTDESGKITSWNKRIAEVTGYDFDEVKDRTCEFLCGNLNHRCPLAEPTKDYPIFNFEQEIFTKSGKLRKISVNIDKIRDFNGNEKGTIVCFEDVTGKKRIEDSLYWQAGVNSAIAALSKAMMSLASLQEISDMILYQACKLTGSKIGFVGYAVPEKHELVVPTYTKNYFQDFSNQVDTVVLKGVGGLVGWALENRQSLVTNNAENELAYDKYYDNNISRFICVPAISGDTVYGVIAIGNPDRQFELDDLEIVERMASLYAIAVHRVKAEEETRLALRKEHELGEMKTRFIATVSHEYRTPLTAILLSTELLNDYGERLSPDEKSKHYGRIRDSVTLMNGLLEDIISFNKFELGKVQVKYQYINIEQFCRATASSVEYMFKGKCPVEFKLIGENALVFTDEKMINQIVTNLLSNALKYSHEGQPVVFKADVTGQGIEFIIIDKGIGIPKEEQSKVLEPFYRAENVGTIPGTGLGMSIVRNSLQLLGGSISFTSARNVGSEFRVQIPVSEKLEIL